MILNDAIDIRVGNGQATAVYQGTKLIWPADGCATMPETVTVNGQFANNEASFQMTRVSCSPGNVQYYWVHPNGPWTGGEATLTYSESGWVYEESLSYAPYGSAVQTSPVGGGNYDPTGTYDQGFNVFASGSAAVIIT